VLNVFSVPKIDPKVHPALLSSLLNKDKKLFHDMSNKTFRFNIVVVAKDGATAEIALRAHLGKEWKDVTVTRIEANA
jgi:hypothetical protein